MLPHLPRFGTPHHDRRRSVARSGGRYDASVPNEGKTETSTSCRLLPRRVLRSPRTPTRRLDFAATSSTTTTTSHVSSFSSQRTTTSQARRSVSTSSASSSSTQRPRRSPVEMMRLKKDILRSERLSRRTSDRRTGSGRQSHYFGGCVDIRSRRSHLRIGGRLPVISASRFQQSHYRVEDESRDRDRDRRPLPSPRLDMIGVHSPCSNVDFSPRPAPTPRSLPPYRVLTTSNLPTRNSPPSPYRLPRRLPPQSPRQNHFPPRTHHRRLRPLPLPNSESPYRRREKPVVILPGEFPKEASIHSFSILRAEILRRQQRKALTASGGSPLRKSLRSLKESAGSQSGSGSSRSPLTPRRNGSYSLSPVIHRGGDLRRKRRRRQPGSRSDHHQAFRVSVSTDHNQRLRLDFLPRIKPKTTKESRIRQESSGGGGGGGVRGRGVQLKVLRARTRRRRYQKRGRIFLSPLATKVEDEDDDGNLADGEEEPESESEEEEEEEDLDVQEESGVTDLDDASVISEFSEGDFGDSAPWRFSTDQSVVLLSKDRNSKQAVIPSEDQENEKDFEPRKMRSDWVEVDGDIMLVYAKKDEGEPLPADPVDK